MHELYWRAEETSEEMVNPGARVADKADQRLDERLRRMRTRFEIERRKWLT